MFQAETLLPKLTGTGRQRLWSQCVTPSHKRRRCISCCMTRDSGLGVSRVVKGTKTGVHDAHAQIRVTCRGKWAGSARWEGSPTRHNRLGLAEGEFARQRTKERRSKGIARWMHSLARARGCLCLCLVPASGRLSPARCRAWNVMEAQRSVSQAAYGTSGGMHLAAARGEKQRTHAGSSTPKGGDVMHCQYQSRTPSTFRQQEQGERSGQR
jgi:hypothetical protein